MIPIKNALRGVLPPGVFPDASRCPRCDYFDITNAGVQEILQQRAEVGNFTYEQWEDMVRCRCKKIEEDLQRRSHLRLLEANLPHNDNPRTFEGFERIKGTEGALHAAEEFSAFQGPKTLMFTSPTGRGKSHLLEAIARVFLKKGATVRYEVASTFLDQLRHTYSSNADLLDVVRWYQTMQLLVIDELGERGSAWANDHLTALIDERLRLGKWLAIGTNLLHDDMADRVGHRLASRLFQKTELGEVKVIALTAGDYRRE